MTARVAVVSLCSSERTAHLSAQSAALAARADVARIVVWIGPNEPPPLAAEYVVRVPPGADGLRLAAARNTGAALAREIGGDLIVFLDADCVPGRGMVDRYRELSAQHRGAVLCGPVTYLPPGVDAADLDDLARRTSPHPARPQLAEDVDRGATDAEYALFWSLSFAVRADTWAGLPHFDERYEGYGGEDTDFAFALRESSVPLVWAGGAHAYHQHHATSSPPWQHLDDILRNGAIFAERWGEWPMRGWLDAFAEQGAIVWDGARWRRS